MRVTSQSFPRQLEFDLTRIKNSVDIAQNQITSGQRVRQSSDDPGAYRRAEGIQAYQRGIQQLRQNIKSVKSRIEQDIATAKSLQTTISRASEITVRTTRGILSANDLQTVAAEVNAMLEGAVSLANKKFNGQYLYGGTGIQTTDTDTVTGQTYVPFIVTRNGAGQITAVSYSTFANEGVQQVEIEDGATMDMNMVGASATGTPRGMFRNGAAGSAGDIFANLIALRDAYAAGSVPTAQGLMDELQTMESNTTTNMGLLSANLERINTAEQAHTIQLQADEETLSSISDTDLASAVFQLQQSQTAFQAALQVGAQTLRLSILDFMR